MDTLSTKATAKKVGNEEHSKVLEAPVPTPDKAPVKPTPDKSVVDPVAPKVEPIVQTVDREGVIETAAHEQSIAGHVADITPISDRQDTGEDPKPKEDTGKGKYVNPVTGISSFGVTMYAPGRHPKLRQIADKAVVEGPARPKVLELVNSKNSK